MDEDLRGIGEMARASGLSVSALRFYDRTAILVPAVVESATGYRRYSAGQVRLARLAAGMRRIGIPLAEIAAVLENHSDPVVVSDVLDGYVRRLEEGLADARRERKRLDALVDIDRIEPATWPEARASLDVGAWEFAQAINGVRFALGNDPLRPELTGALVEFRDTAVRLAATDRYRLAVRSVPARLRFGSTVSVTVPASLLDDVGALLDYDGDVTIDLEGSHITVTTDSGRVSTTCIEETFPEYRPLIEEAVADLRFDVDADELRARLDAGPTHSVRRETDGVLTQVVVLTDSPDGGLSVATADEEAGRLTVAVNRDFLAEALDASGSPQLVFEFGGSLSPLAIRVPDDDQFVALLMPVRL